MLRILATSTFALWVAAWLVYCVAWDWAAPRRRAHWILASAVGTILASIATAVLFVGMLLS